MVGRAYIDSEPKLVLDCRNCLSESPLWDPAAERLYWTNIHDKEVWSWNGLPGTEPRVYPLPERAGAIGLREAGGLVLALETGFAVLDTESGEVHRIATLPNAQPATRLNDGRVDPAGRFVCGGMNEESPQRGTAALYTLHADRSVHTVLDNIACANSTCWSPDGKTLYFADMPTQRIDAFDYDTSTGALSNRREFASLRAERGLPDGSIVDEEGCLWNAQWGGAKIVRYTPDGAVDREIVLPVSNPTCLAFGGKNLDTLFVTSACFTLDATMREREPHAGSLFALKPGVRGIPDARYRG
jgi:L-arabinonolactonase